MTSVELRSLGHYPELKTDDGIDGIIAYKQTLAFPANIITANQRFRYVKKYQHFVVIPVAGLPDHLQYEPRAGVHLLVIRPDDRTAALDRTYNKYLATGINSFYSLVCQDYLGISKKVATEYLKSKGDYQIATTYRKTQNTHIFARTSNERWAMDLIHLSSYVANANNNGRNEYILTVVDYFSRKIWARPILVRDAAHIRDALISIMYETHSYPHILQTDNGGEFRGDLSRFIEQYDIVHPNEKIDHIYTQTHSPTSNGLVERMNGEIRRKMRMGFIQSNSKNWTLLLPKILATINMQVPTRKKYSPEDLYTQGYHPPPNGLVNFRHKPKDTSTRVQIENAVKANIIRSAALQFKNQLKDTKRIFNVGDHVRIKLATLFADVRERKKNQSTNKQNAIHWSLYTRTIRSVIPGSTIGRGRIPITNIWSIRNPQYTLNDDLGQPVRNWFPGQVARRAVPALGLPAHAAIPAGFTTIRLFWGSDLLHVTDPAHTTPISIAPISEYQLRFINNFPRPY
jgi:transposase InsO family protein